MQIPKLFTAPWCASCEMMKRQLDELKITYQLIDISTEDGEVTASFYGVKSIPAFGKRDYLVTGLRTKDFILEYMKEFFE